MDACQRKRYLLRFIFLLVVFLSCIQYVDADCNITTPGVHTFGSECQYMCHCKNGESCNTTTGECTSGCDKYWFGPGCQYRDLAENEYSRHASNLVNSPHQYAPRGNDGDISTCSFTKEAGSSTVNPWWRVILENEITITDIDILTTTDGLQYLHEFKVTVEKLPYSKKGSHDRPPDTIVCYQHNNTIPDNTNIHVTCTSPLIGNQVRITLSEIQSQLIVCDFRINRECTYNKWGPSCQNECGACIQGTCGVVTGKCTGGCLNGYINTDDSCKTECVSGLYGYNCQSNCSEHCKNSCDKVNGTCIDGCNPGYIGDKCERECQAGTYGQNCQNKCYENCNFTCHHVNGSCTRCNAGWKGDNCNTECDNGTYGIECQQTCSNKCLNVCNKVNGACTSCIAGWTGNYCDDKCLNGTYGLKCSEQCNSNCIDICNHVTGKCTQCMDGWKGDFCDEECRAGTYGQNCQNKCYENCNLTCHHVNGTCTSCNAGWKGDNCNTECDNGTYGIECQQTCTDKCLNGCNTVNGACTSCIAGWTGNYCDDKCLNGTHGLKCSEQCNSNCIDICNHVSGKCTQCMDGWKGDFCDEECRAGTYGQNCQNKCYENCNLTCYHVNGTCTSCNAGWKGDNCNTECDNGTYGIECQQTCTDTCLNGCNTVNGACTSCIAGWTGNYCDDKCLNGTYGLKCSEQCNSNCLDICDHVTGKCTQCMDGWKGDFCDEDCPDGTYGANCTEPCTPRCLNSCNKQTGNCTQCIDGWTGNICETECTDGTYGQNCNYSCSAQCTNVCAKDNGYCNCTTGWHGDTCQDECEDGSYGDYCKEQCGNCKDEIICDKINGTCHEGCDSGFEGSLCTSKIVQPPPPNEGFPVAAIAGIVSSVVVIVIIVVIVFIVIKRRSGNKNNGYTESTDNTETGWKNVSGNHKKNGSDNLKIVYSVKHDDPVYENSIDLLPQPDEMNDVHLQPTASSSKSTTNTEKGDVNDYYVFGNEPVGEKSLTAIALNNLTQYVKSKIANVNFFNNEFQDIPYGLQHPTLNATKPSNMGKNRYKELFAYDHARVVLKTLPTEPNSDYINASYIKGYKKDRAYIAAQGPTENNENEFWRMVWENNVNLIVMLTKLIEETKKKCVQYWTEKGNSKTFGKVTVFTESEEEFAEFTVRRLKITYDGKREKRIVTHYIYTAWPDKTIPHSTCSLLQFWHKVRKHDADKTKPWLVHCSAGVGRTGTFIALDYLYDQGVDAGFIDINVCVRLLRNQRVNMVQVKEQYRYLYRIMIEALIVPSTPILVHNFDAYYTDLLMIDQKTRQPKLKLQFETMSQTDGLVKDTKTQQYACKDAKLAINKAKNRYSNILASDEFRPFMSTHVPGTTDYINAIYMPSYSDLFSYIITQSPLPDTAVDCCRLIIDQDIRVVVTFNNDGDNEVGVYLPSKGSIEAGPFEVTSNNEEVKHGYVIRRHTLTFKSKEHEVVQVVCQKWPTNKLVPEDPSTVLEMLQDINDLQRHYENKPVLLQCLNGAERSGLFVVLLNIIERSRIEEEVSIVQVVRYLRSRRQQIVPNFEQYKFCHDVLLSYTESNSTYANL